jgi:hypothetical protein
VPRDDSGSAENPEVARSEGSTPSERYLAKLCDRSFLNLWSYPNVYIDKRKGGKGDGKELCDLLVVCGDHVLIFSDKTIAWQDDNDVLLSWKRWFNRAVHHSARQIRKAERWIKQMPDQIYLDKSCTKPLPFKLPPIERRKVHGIVVALGAAAGCRAFFGDGIGSLMILPEIKGDQHFKGDEVIPCSIGDVDPNGPFIHVLDEATLDIVMGELVIDVRETSISGLLKEGPRPRSAVSYLIRVLDEQVFCTMRVPLLAIQAKCASSASPYKQAPAATSMTAMPATLRA